MGAITVLCVLVGAGVAWGKPSEHPFEIVPGSFQFGPSNDSAGAHADWTVSWDFAHNAKGETYNDVRTMVVDLPAGFDASNTVVPTCSDAQLLERFGARVCHGYYG